MAGVTLLALANGAGDVITAIVASKSEEGVYYNIGSIYGAGLFIAGLVIGIAVVKNGYVKYDRMIVLRDISIYIFATALTLAYGYFGEINWYNSLALLLIYVVQVTIVYFQDMGQKANTVDIVKPLSDDFLKTVPGMKVGTTDEVGENQNLIDTRFRSSNNNAWEGVRKSFTDIEKRNLPLEVSQKMGLVKPRYIARSRLTSKIEKSVIIRERNENPFTRQQDSAVREYIVHESPKTILDILWVIIDFPFKILGYFTLLPCEFTHYSYTQSLIWSFTGVFFQFFTLFRLDWTLTIFTICFIVCLSYLTAFLIMGSVKDENSRPYKFIVVNSVISSIFWMYFLIEILMSLLETLAVVYDLHAAFLGFTVLAIGNAMTDMFSTLALFEMKGREILALSGAYNGQLFGVLIGFGLGNLKMSLHYGPQDFHLFNRDSLEEKLIPEIVMGVSLFVLVATWLAAVLGDYKVKRGFGFFLISAYASFFVFATWYGLKH